MRRKYLIKNIYICKVEIIDYDEIRDEIWPFYLNRVENRLIPIENTLDYYHIKEQNELKSYLEKSSGSITLEEIKRVIEENKLGKRVPLVPTPKKEEQPFNSVQQDITLYEEETLTPLYKVRKKMKFPFQKAS